MAADNRVRDLMRNVDRVDAGPADMDLADYPQSLVPSEDEVLPGGSAVRERWMLTVSSSRCMRRHRRASACSLFQK